MPRTEQWAVVGASVPGRVARSGRKPMQDRNRLAFGAPEWGVAAVCDGAGSCPHSDRGAEAVAAFTVQWLLRQSGELGWWRPSSMGPEEWRREGRRLLHDARRHLDERAGAELGAEPDDLSCTLIALLFAPGVLRLVHVGDGRAGYRTGLGHWQALLWPIKGEYSNETSFLTSWAAEAWQTGEGDEDFGSATVEAPGLDAWVLATDGAEGACFLCRQPDGDTGRYHDVNLPFPDFFDPCVDALRREGHENDARWAEVEAQWSALVEHGSNRLIRLRDEEDDKTLVLAARLEAG